MRQTGTAQYAAFSPHLYEVPQEMFGDEFGTVTRHGQGNMTIPTPPEDYPSDVFGLGQDSGWKKEEIPLRVVGAALSLGAAAGGLVLLNRYTSWSFLYSALGTVLFIGGATGLRISLRPLFER